MCPGQRESRETGQGVRFYPADALAALTRDRPCSMCGSMRHGSGAHARLEKAYERWGLGLTSSVDQPELDLAGTPGAPSPSTNASARPDRLQIVPFTISEGGITIFRSAAIMRLWKQDPEGGCTFTLSWARLDEDEGSLVFFLAKLFGVPGSVVTVELGSSRSSLSVEPPGTSVST